MFLPEKNPERKIIYPLGASLISTLRKSPLNELGNCFYALLACGNYFVQYGCIKSAFSAYSLVKLGFRFAVLWFFVFLYL